VVVTGGLMATGRCDGATYDPKETTSEGVDLGCGHAAEQLGVLYAPQ
jgi:hypothetical protein